MITVKTIVETYLKRLGYDGLVNDEGCGCRIDAGLHKGIHMELMECGCQGIEQCVPAKLIKSECGDECELDCDGIHLQPIEE